MFKIFITYNSSYSFYMKMFYETKWQGHDVGISMKQSGSEKK